MSFDPSTAKPVSDSVAQPKSSNSNLLSSLLSKVNPNQVAYSVAGGTVTEDIGGALAEKVTGQKSGIGGIAPQAEKMRMNGIDAATSDPIGRIALNIATDPLTYIGLGASKQAVSGIVQAEGRLQKATKAKAALDALRTTLGQAKNLAIKEVEQIPTKLDMAGAKSTKILDALNNPIYEIEKNADGSLKQTVGNLDKVKEAVGELINTPKVWEESPNKELRIVKQFYGQINESMKSAAKYVGKPIDKALDSYHKFMDNYYLVNRSLVDTAGNAMGNKLRNTFRVGAEPAVKDAWREVSAASPAIKKIMGTMQQRELIKNLLMTAGVGSAGAYAAKKLGTIAGNMSSGAGVSFDDGQ